jgi:hypothetical protein
MAEVKREFGVVGRHGLGGHPYGASAAIVDERRHGQVGGAYRDDE